MIFDSNIFFMDKHWISSFLQEELNSEEEEIRNKAEK